MLRWMSDPEELPPPWAKHPEIPLGSIGWRMGYGESWMMRWGEWLEQQPRDRGWRVAYLRRHPPAPRSWAHAVAGVLEPAREDEEDADEDYEAANERLAKQLAVEGLVGDDVAMGAWEALHGAGPEAPWAAGWHAGKLGSAARYGGRELTFWAWERIAVLVAAHAEAPAPWELGEPPSSLRQEYEDDSSYADAWCSWVYDAFDDGSSWRAYLERHGPVPAEWRETIERVIYIGG
jgi:hypothetical protein